MNALLRWNPALTRSRSLHHDFDRFFDGWLTPSLLAPVQGLAAPADVHETPEAYLIRLDVPGLSQKDVKVTVMGDTVTIRGERKQEEKVEHDNVHYRERRFGSFERGFTLGTPVRADQVKASYRDGVLEVRVPKADEARSREVEIQVG